MSYIGIDKKTRSPLKAPSILSGIQNVKSALNRAFKFFFSDLESDGNGIPLSIWSSETNLDSEFPASEYLGCLAVSEVGQLKLAKEGTWSDIEGAHNHDGDYAFVEHEHDLSVILDPAALTVDMNSITWGSSGKHVITEEPNETPPIAIGTFDIAFQRYQE